MEPGMERLNKVFETLVLNVGKILRDKGYLFNNLPNLKRLLGAIVFYTFLVVGHAVSRETRICAWNYFRSTLARHC